MLAEQVERQAGAALMNEKHVEDGKLDYGLICAGADSIEGARQVPLRRTIELGLPHH